MRLFSVTLLTLISTALAVVAQTVTIKSQPLRITVPVGVASNATATVTIVTGGSFGSGVNFAVTGIPAGCTATLSTNNINVAGTHIATLSFSSPINLDQGQYEMAIEATGDASFRLPVPVISAHFWSGSAYTNGTSTNWNNSGNWLSGVIPNNTNNVVLGNLGGTTNNTSPTNVIITANATIGGLQFANDANANAKAYNIEFQGGSTLSIVGAGGFQMLRDQKVASAAPTASQTMDLKIAGNGQLVVSNNAATFANHIDGQLNATLDMRDLNYFYAQVNRLPFGDFRAYPNFYTNGWVGSGTGNEVSRFAPIIYLAKTNIIKAAYVDPNNYNDLGERNYALTIGNYSRQGTTANLRFTLGNSNLFLMDSICFSQALQGGSTHNYNFNSSNSVAIFRGTGGLSSRMSVFVIADSASGAAPAAANTRGQVNFQNTINSSVDALVDRLWIGVDRTNNSSQMTVQGTLTYSNGVFDVNDAYLGYQRSGNNQGDAAATGFAGPEGTVTVNGSGVLKVNRDLHLGFTTASAAGGNTSPERAFGKVNVGLGTLQVSNVVVGGTTKFSTNNSITVGGGKLFVTNAIGAANARLAIFTATNGSQITLRGVKVGETNVFVKKLNIPGGALGSGVLNIPVIGGSPTYPVTIPVISYDSTLPADPALIGGLVIGTLPSGVRAQTTVDNTVNQTIDITFATGAPNLLAWRGNINNVWDTSTKNWVTVPGGVSTNFIDGDSVIFDDAATGSTSIIIPGTVIPGQAAATYGIAMTNITKNYTFTGGNVSGAVTFFKAGSGSLTNNSTFSPGITMIGGSLAGSGSVGPTVLADGVIMTAYTGSISGGLDVSNATVTVNSVGSVAGGLIVRAGALLNNGTVGGTVSLSGGATLNNNYGATMNVNLPWSIPTNAVVINNGTISQSGPNGGNLGLTVRGTLQGVGKITQPGGLASSDCRVTMEAGGNLMIGNSVGELTNMTIAVRLDFNAGSVTTFDVNNSVVTNDVINLKDGLLIGKVNFGSGNSQGGSLVINKIAGPAFNASTVLYLFDVTSGFVPDNLNQAIPAVSPIPAPGLTWNVYNMTTNLTLEVTTPPFMTNSITVGTNGVRSFEFTWPETYRGWRLELQTNTLAVGLESPSTNWVTLVSSLGGSNPPSMYYPDTNDLSIRYFRSIQSFTGTNGVGTNPASFYRMTYP